MEKEKKSKKKIIIILLILLLLILLLLFFLFFNKKEYQIKFDSNGGSEISSITVKEDNKIEKPKDPVREGYVFSGWYYKDELFNFDTPVKENITLIAKWSEGEGKELEGIALNTSELLISPDSSVLLEVSFIPEGVEPVKLIWSSSDESLVIVDENGNVKGLKEGTAVITIKTEDGKYSATCNVTVKNDIISVTGITVSGAKEVTVGKSIQLTATVSPDNATDKSVTWSTSNSKIATVDQNGKVTAKKAGKVTITATTVEGGHKSEYNVTVKEDTQNNKSNNNTNTSKPSTNNNSSSNNNQSKPNNSSSSSKPSTVQETGVTLNRSNATLTEGQTLNLTATITPSNATNKSLTWSSNDSNIATVDQNGKVTAKKAGTVTITVRTANGKTATCTITVKEKEASYSIVLTAISQEGTGNVMQYTFVVYKNGNPFNDYQSFTIGKRGARNGSKQISLEDKTSKSASLVLSNGTTVTASVTYK